MKVEKWNCEPIAVLKKAVLLDGNPQRIFLFSPDNQGYGREMLFKRS